MMLYTYVNFAICLLCIVSRGVLYMMVGYMILRSIPVVYVQVNGCLFL